MSFMAGLAQGFNTTFREGLERKEQRKQDTFRVMYDDFKSRREEINKTKQEDRKTVAKAKALTEGMNVPQGAWIKAYEWLQAGLDEETVAARLSTGTFKATEMPAGQVGQGGKSELSQQTDAAFRPEMAGAPGAPKGADAIPQTPQASRTSNVFQESSGIFTQEQDYAAEAAKRIASIAGVDPQQVHQIISGTPESSVDTSGAPTWTPGPKPQPELPDLDQAIFNRDNARTDAERKLAEAQVEAIEAAEIFKSGLKQREQGFGAKGGLVKYMTPEGKWQTTLARVGEDGQTLVDPQGNPIAEPFEVGDEEIKSMQEVAKTGMAEEARNYRSALEAIPQVYRLGEDMAQAVSENPGLQQGAVSGAVNVAQRWIAEALAAGQLAGVDPSTDPYNLLEKFKNGEGITAEEASNLNTLHQELEGILGADVNNLAVAKTLQDTRTALMAYYIGSMMGQEGRELQEPERKMFMDVATGGITLEQFERNMAIILGQGESKVRSTYNSISSNPVLKTHEAIYGEGSFPAAVVTDPEDFMAEISEQDPLVKAGMERFRSRMSTGDRMTPGRPGDAPKAEALRDHSVPEGWKYIGKTKDGTFRDVYLRPDGRKVTRKAQ